MKYALILFLVLLVLGGVYLFTSSNQDVTNVTTEVQEGSHLMPDGSLMEDTVEMDPELDGASTEEVDEDQASVTIDPNARVFDVNAVNYAFSVKEIRVQEGDTVTINFESTDGFHDWVVDEFNAKTDRVQPGTPTSVTFVADKKGTFEYYCSVGSHRAHGMVGKLIVE